MSEANLPSSFVRRLIQIHGDDRTPQLPLPAFHDDFTCFRINTLITSIDDAIGALNECGIAASPVPWLAEAFTVEAEKRHDLVRCELVDDGRIYVQGLSSMLATVALDPQPGERVLDLAAAPGGKTLHMAARMNGQGRITAVEAVRDRFFKLQANITRAGAANMVTAVCKDGATIGQSSPNLFDRVLLDAPCSSEARIRENDPASWRFWSEKKIKQCARKQKSLLRSAFAAARPGGLILYCTCTFAPEENEGVIHHTLDKLGEAVELLPLNLPIDNTMPGLTSWNDKRFDERMPHCRRVLPNDQMDGFFLALLRKNIG